MTTYQAGKLVVLRADQDHVNTHFRNLSKPMGLAVAGDRLAVGTLLEIWEFHNVPAVIPKLEPIGRHDACYLPRSSHVTGDVQIHEMAWVGDELWFVNTRFSCLCTRGAIHSFVPRWRPPFVSALAPEDRCHLNGLGLVDGQARYVTALAETDTPAGWRANKKDGGVLMDVTTNEVLLRGLSMPHSPRWYDGRLWVLESGTGGVGFVDPALRPLRGGGRAARLYPRTRLSRTAGLRRPVAGARERRLQRHRHRRARCRNGPAASGCWTCRRARPSRSCASRMPSRRSSPSRCCRGVGFPT